VESIALERMGLRVSRSKADYIEYEFREKEPDVDGGKEYNENSDNIIGEVESFKYLGFFM